jgi:hypothetical protein
MSPLALARLDIERTALSAEVQTNWMPRVLGSMMLRAGTEYRGSTYLNRKAYHLNFIYALSDQAQIELTDNAMRVLIDDVAISRPSVSSAIANGGFDTTLTSWTDADEAGCTSQWVAGGYMGLVGTGINSAIRTQQVTVSGGNINVEHGIRVKINRGVVKFKVGSSADGEQYVPEATLREGEYSFAFTPTGNFHITVSASTQYQSLVDSITLEAAGDVAIPTAWGEDDLPFIRYDQSADIIYVACNGIRQYKIERRAARSWGVAEYLSEDGPFRAENISQISIAPSGLTGDITLTASKAVFSSGSVGSLYRTTSIGQSVNATLTGSSQFSGEIRVIGVGAQRAFTRSVSGVFSATVVLQRSVSEPGSWVTVESYTSGVSSTYNDGLDNQIVYYRLGILSSGYTSGTVNVGMSYASGGITGIARVTAFNSSTSVNAIVLTALGSTGGSTSWSESSWSPRRGYPSAVAFDEGRLWWAGKDNIYGSVSDAFESFDDTIEGDSGPIIRSIGSGPIDRINWLLPLQRLVIGAEMSERVIRSNSLDEPITPTVFNIKSPSTRGSTNVAPVKVDTSGLFVRGDRLFELRYDAGELEYKTVDLTSYVPEIGVSGFSRIAVQRYPDTRIHCIRSNGTAGVLVFDRNEDMRCWIDFETDGIVEDVIVQPAVSALSEDYVYYIIKRIINGSTVRYRERFALEADCVGGTQNKQADCFLDGTQSSSATITGLSHLEGEAVIVWANGKCYSPRVNGVQTTFTVTGGQITLPEAVTDYVVGLPYKARYKSVKLAYAAQGGTALLQSKRIEQLGVILRNTHNRGLRYGRDFDNMDEMPLFENGEEVTADIVWEEYDERPFEFEQEFDTDSRLCLEAMAPMPCTLLATVMKIATNEKV